MKKKKYLIKNLTRSLFKKILEKSKNYLILKSFKNDMINKKRFKSVVICKFATPSNLNITKVHYLIHLIVGSDSSEFKDYIKNIFFNGETDKNIQRNFFKNSYPLVIKKNGILFNDYKVYICFFYLFEILKIFTKIHFIINLMKLFIKFIKIK